MITSQIVTYQIFASVQCEKVLMHLPQTRLPPMQRKASTISLTYCELYMWTQIDQTKQHHPCACCSLQKALALVNQLVFWLILPTVEL